MAGVVLAAVTARAPEVPADCDAEFWAIVARLRTTVATACRCHDRDVPPPGASRTSPPARGRPVVRRPSGRERSPPHAGGASPTGLR